MTKRPSSSLSSIAAFMLLASVAPMGITAQARTPRPDLPDRFELGRNVPGEPCAASRDWGDPSETGYFSDSYSIICRGATAGRPVGIVRSYKIADAAKAEATLNCSAPSMASVERLGMVATRRCIDNALGYETVVTSIDAGDRRFLASMVPSGQGVAEEALRTLSGKAAVNPDRNRKSAPRVDIASLAAAPAVAASDAAVVDSDTALQLGLRFVRQGLHMEASRVLNDALSRLPADAPVATRAELLLVAALADSNLRFFDSAAEGFARADRLLAENPGMPNAAVLIRKRENYAALDMLNRRQFAGAISALDRIVSDPVDPRQPLTDVAIVRSLNQAPSGRADTTAGAVATPDISTLSQLVIDAQANWARSVALLAQNRPEDARVALDTAERSFEVLQRERVDQKQVLWLEARIARQRARIQGRQGDVNGAVASLDRAIASLNRAGADGSGSGPALAETQMERAAIASRGTKDRGKILDQFDSAIDSLIASGASGSVLPPSIEQYLDLLTVEAKENPSGTAGDRFFRAIQAVGEPAVARQFTQLQSIVTTDPSLAAKVQDRSELEREITQVRFQLTAAAGGDSAQIATLDKQRSDAEARLQTVENELQASNAFSAVDDRPVTIAEMQANLKPGEAYFKVTEIRNYAFGILIDGQGYRIYRIERPMVEVKPLAELVRSSIDGGGEKLPVYRVAAAYALFQLVAGPVADRLLAARSVVVDPSGPLEKLPLGVLVADRASVTRYTTTAKAQPYDYSMIDFLAKRVAISSALSPRSFIVSRRLPASTASQPFMGFAEHMPIQLNGQFGGRMISIGSGCIVELKAIAALSNQLTPINSSELVRAEAALGISGAPTLTGAAFTDTAIEQRTDLDQFQVLHFATHGLTEGQWACRKSPPALVTSLGDDKSDGILSFSEIARLHLNANLVVLSACDTASGVSEGEARAAGQEESGATLEGLVRAFLAANARAVLTTYWPISDEGESETLIENFYRAGRSADIATALRTAQTGMMNEPKASHPIYWGAFFVVGDASKTMLSGATQVANVAVAATPPR